MPLEPCRYGPNVFPRLTGSLFESRSQETNQVSSTLFMAKQRMSPQKVRLNQVSAGKHGMMFINAEALGDSR